MVKGTIEAMDGQMENKQTSKQILSPAQDQGSLFDLKALHTKNPPKTYFLKRSLK